MRLNQQRIRWWLAGIGFAAVVAGVGVRASFEYVGRELLVGFRQAGAASEVVANVGAVSNYAGLQPGTTIVITNLSSALLRASFPNLNNLNWSVTACVRTNTDPTYPLQTLWVTRARQALGTPANPWLRQSQFSQGNS